MRNGYGTWSNITKNVFCSPLWFLLIYCSFPSILTHNSLDGMEHDCIWWYLGCFIIHVLVENKWFEKWNNLNTQVEMGVWLLNGMHVKAIRYYASDALLCIITNSPSIYCAKLMFDILLVVPWNDKIYNLLSKSIFILHFFFRLTEVRTMEIKSESAALVTHVCIRTELYLIHKYNGANTYDIILFITLLCWGKYANVRRPYINI